MVVLCFFCALLCMLALWACHATGLAASEWRWRGVLGLVATGAAWWFGWSWVLLLVLALVVPVAVVAWRLPHAHPHLLPWIKAGLQSEDAKLEGCVLWCMQRGRLGLPIVAAPLGDAKLEAFFAGFGAQDQNFEVNAAPETTHSTLRNWMVRVLVASNNPNIVVPWNAPQDDALLQAQTNAKAGNEEATLQHLYASGLQPQSFEHQALLAQAALQAALLGQKNNAEVANTVAALLQHKPSTALQQAHWKTLEVGLWRLGYTLNPDVQHKTPLFTIGLLLLLLLVFFAQLYHASWLVSDNPMRGFDIAALDALGGNYRDATFGQLELARLCSSVLLHGGIAHLAMNALALWSLGRALEWRAGGWALVAAFGITGFLASLASCVFNPENVVSVGASGGIFGVFGALVSCGVSGWQDIWDRVRRNAPNMLLVLLTSNVVGNVDNAAHVGGLVAGLVLGVYLQSKRVGLLAALGAGVLVVGLWRVAIGLLS